VFSYFRVISLNCCRVVFLLQKKFSSSVPYYFGNNQSPFDMVIDLYLDVFLERYLDY
jgi:hypothetical protein